MGFKKVSKKFYLQPTLAAAKNLLGKYIVRKYGQEKIVGRIIETEAYLGPKDKAAHSYLSRKNFRFPSERKIEKFFGKKLSQDKTFLKNLFRGGGKITERNKIVYWEGGYIYIYLVYGMYWQMNIVTAVQGKPECVLIRAVEPVSTNDRHLADGPGKLCRWLKLDKSFYGEDLTKSKRIWLEDDGRKISANQILATKRIGIDYAGPYWSRRKLRFVLKNSF